MKKYFCAFIFCILLSSVHVFGSTYGDSMAYVATNDGNSPNDNKIFFCVSDVASLHSAITAPIMGGGSKPPPVEPRFLTWHWFLSFFL